MANSMLEYVKLILEKVSFDKELFEKELKIFSKKLVRLKKNCTFAPALKHK